ncbi:MAG TPA: sugar-binding domain-containing protein [Ornithinibacter sp.]|nr:sugar-binding domain-containing protein [Ornithinibacter sp.]
MSCTNVHPEEAAVTDRYDRLYAVAERHYLQGETMESIARSLTVSRSTVSRMLTQARDEGIVRISLAQRGSASPWAERLTQAFGVRAHLVDVGDSAAPGARLDVVARRAAQVASSLVADDTTVGVAWGVTVAAVAKHLESRPLAGVTVVQLNGSVNAVDTAVPYVGAILATVANAFGARVVPFPVPAFFDHAATKDAVCQESAVTRVEAERARLDLALFGVGALRGAVPSRVYSAGYLDAEAIATLERDGVVGDVNTVLLREDGTYADIELNRRATGLDPEALRRVPRRVCVVADPLRARALLGALRAGVITDLVCDGATAQAVVRRMA